MRRIGAMFGLWLSSALTLAGCARPHGDTDARIDALLRQYTGAVPGAAVLVLRDGVAVLRRAYGLADLEQHVAATPATNYRLASMTKQFTAAAILALTEDGRLSLDDPVRKWLPALPPAADAVTIRQLLESQNRTYFAPGTSYRYSNSGYALLALIVARASGEDFASFLRTRIFLPLGMRNTVAYEAGISTVAERAFGYSEERGVWRRTDQSATSAVLGDGGVYSSIDDLTKWDAALYDEQLLSARSLRLAFTPATPTDDPAVRYGFGWRITGETLWHSGETVGFRNVIIRYPCLSLTHWRSRSRSSTCRMQMRSTLPAVLPAPIPWRGLCRPTGNESEAHARTASARLEGLLRDGSPNSEVSTERCASAPGRTGRSLTVPAQQQSAAGSALPAASCSHRPAISRPA